MTDHTAATVSPQDVPVRNEVILRKEFYHRSLDLFLAMIKKDPINVPAWGHCGLLLYELGRFEESLSYFQKIIDHEPDNSVAWDATGFIRMERGDFSGAAAAFLKVVELSPRRTDVISDMSLCIFKTGDYRAALDVIDRHLKKTMGTKEYYLLGMIAEKLGEDPTPHWEHALAAYRHPEGPVREGVFATLAEMRGVILARFSRDDEARDALIEAGERASLTDPDRMILSAVDLTFRVRGDFIREARQLIPPHDGRVIVSKGRSPTAP